MGSERAHRACVVVVAVVVDIDVVEVGRTPGTCVADVLAAQAQIDRQQPRLGCMSLFFCHAFKSQQGHMVSRAVIGRRVVVASVWASLGAKGSSVTHFLPTRHRMKIWGVWCAGSRCSESSAPNERGRRVFRPSTTSCIVPTFQLLRDNNRRLRGI
jgi:hypothetical protein